MLKGHTKIELTNIHTGEKEVVEHNNMFTNALQNLINGMVFHGINITNYTPIYNTLLGGVILFSQPLEEDADKYTLSCLPDKGLTGYANTEVNSGTDTSRGSFNSTESGEIENGYRYVWDFSTSQGNGEISALGLTSNDGGANPMYGLLQTSLSNPCSNSNEMRNVVEVDFENLIFTMIYSSGEKAVTYKRAKIDKFEVGLLKKYGSAESIQEKTITVDDSNVSMNTSWSWTDGGDGFYYGGYASSEKYLKLIRVDKDTLSYDSDYGLKTITLPTTISIYGNRKFVVSNNYLFYAYNYSAYRVNLSDFTDIKMFTTNVYCYGYVHKFGDFIVCESCIFDMNMENIRYRENSSFISNSTNYCDYNVLADEKGNAFVCYDYRGSPEVVFGFLKNYLATINNLDSTVTKTPDKTMKITYTVTEAAEPE